MTQTAEKAEKAHFNTENMVSVALEGGYLLDLAKGGNEPHLIEGETPEAFANAMKEDGNYTFTAYLPDGEYMGHVEIERVNGKDTLVDSGGNHHSTEVSSALVMAGEPTESVEIGERDFTQSIEDDERHEVTRPVQSEADRIAMQPVRDAERKIAANPHAAAIFAAVSEGISKSEAKQSGKTEEREAVR